MPSYYDSTKKKPGKATLKYNEGGTLKEMSPEEKRKLKAKVNAAKLRVKSGKMTIDHIKKSGKDLKKMDEGGRTSLRERARRRLLPTTDEQIEDAERRHAEGIARAERVIAGRKKEAARQRKRVETEDARDKSRLDKKAEDKAKWAAAAERNKQREADASERAGLRQSRSHGGRIRVTGMGAATRGGNFTRNG